MSLNRFTRILLRVILTLFFIILIPAYFVFDRIYERSISASPLGRDIDFNGDGEISLMEAIDGSEIKHHLIIVNGKKCTEFTEPKTGSIWRVVCE